MIETDKEHLVAMLQRANIAFEDDSTLRPSCGGSILVRGGYDGFYTIFMFDEAGRLEEVAAYE